MAISPLKFSFGISLLVHGVVIGGAAWLGQFHRVPAKVAVGSVTTLELIAAPVGPAETLVETVSHAVTAPPAPPPPPPPTPVPEAVGAAPAAESPPVATPVPISSPVPVAVREEIGAQVGDGSSPLPGKDETALKGSPTALARPDYLKNQEPDYPLAARRRGQQGVVLLSVTVSPAGRATEVTVKQSSGFAVLDEAALRAVRDYEFVPAQLGAIPVESKIEVPIRFKLNH